MAHKPRSSRSSNILCQVFSLVFLVSFLYLSVSILLVEPSGPYTPFSPRKTAFHLGDFSYKPSPTPHGFLCSTEMIAKQVNFLRKSLHKDRRWSACPSTNFLKLFAEQTRDLASPQRPMTFVNVGANKEYAFAEWYGDWIPDLGLNPRSMREFYRMAFPHLKQLCGWCMDCHYDGPEKITKKNLPLLHNMRVFALEPAPQNIELLRAMKEWLGQPESLHLVQAASSNVSGQVLFPVGSPGAEAGFIGDVSKTEKTVIVPAVTVDQFSLEHGIEMIDLLKIDTEGFDPLVLEGAQNVLSQQRVRVLNFEYHSVNHWASDNPAGYSLEKTTDFLDFVGYDCYLEGQGSFIRLTGCWDSSFEIRKWSNVLCVLRTEHSLSQLAFMLSESIHDITTYK